MPKLTTAPSNQTLIFIVAKRESQAHNAFKIYSELSYRF